MSKRFTDTEKWERPWFRALPLKGKMFWLFVCDKCDIAGIWYVDFELASFFLGEKVTEEEMLPMLSKQVSVLNNRSKWQINSFTDFQYGKLRPINNLHRSVIARLKKVNPRLRLDLGLTKSQGKGKGKGIIHTNTNSVFDSLWEQYPRKLGKPAALKHFLQTVTRPEDEVDINNALKNFLSSRQAKGDPQYIPYGSTWFNNWQDWITYKEPKTELEIENERRAEIGLRPKTKLV